MAALVNPIAAGVRQIKRATVAKTLQEKQDRAANLERIDHVLQLRPKDIRPVGPIDYRNVGARWGIPPVRLHVLSEKESGIEGGFQRDGRVTIMNEPAKFSQFTAHFFDMPTYDAVNDQELPAFSYPKFTRKRDFKKLPKQWVDAWRIHPYDFSHRDRWALWSMWATQNFDAAVKSISIGRFQVMGFHWQAMGFESPLAMLEYAYEGEAAHLDLCIRWFRMNDLIGALAKGSWHDVAIYNGTGDRALYARECASIEQKRAAMYA